MHYRVHARRSLPASHKASQGVLPDAASDLLTYPPCEMPLCAANCAPHSSSTTGAVLHLCTGATVRTVGPVSLALSASDGLRPGTDNSDFNARIDQKTPQS